MPAPVVPVRTLPLPVAAKPPMVPATSTPWAVTWETPKPLEVAPAATFDWTEILAADPYCVE